MREKSEGEVCKMGLGLGLVFVFYARLKVEDGEVARLDWPLVVFVFLCFKTM